MAILATETPKLPSQRLSMKIGVTNCTGIDDPQEWRKINVQFQVSAVNCIPNIAKFMDSFGGSTCRYDKYASVEVIWVEVE